MHSPIVSCLMFDILYNLMSSWPCPRRPRFQAAICNLYHAARRPSDRLGGHRDDVEEAVDSFFSPRLLAE